MGQLDFMAPVSQEVLSTFFSSKNIGLVVLVFLVTMAVLMLMRFIKSVIFKLLLALVVVGLVVVYLYFKAATGIRF
jgi:hypothetical protein